MIIANEMDEIEKIVSENDSLIQNAMDSNRIDSIQSISNRTVTSLSKKYFDVQNIQVPDNGKNFKMTAESYITSLIDFVKTQNLYAAFSDTITEQEAKIIDDKNAEAIKVVELQHKRYKEYRTAFDKIK
ncbi:MAG: hypothetical protein ACLVKO_12080 [Dysgonomonas sp.]